MGKRMKTEQYLIGKLKLKKHPEGGHYRELYRSEEHIPSKGLPRRYSGKRAFSTSIYYLLCGKEVSRFHRLNSDELWHFYAGSPLTIHVISTKGKYSTIRLGACPDKGQVFQCTIKRNSWVGATVNNVKSFSLVGCTVAPGFDFADFETAEEEELVRLCPRRKIIIAKLTWPDFRRTRNLPRRHSSAHLRASSVAGG
jgi:predicted cupin superfamily sugar epimerase